MLSGRPHLRDNHQRETTSVLVRLLSALIAGFVLQLVLEWNAGTTGFYQLAGLTTSGLQEGRYWTLLTHSFLHSPHFIFHVVGNVVALYFIGRKLLPILGARVFLGTYAVATVVGGLTWSAIHWRLGGDMLVGATPAVAAFLIVFAGFFPDREFNFLLFFVVPVSVRLKHVAYALFTFDLIGLFFYEIPGTVLPLGLTFASSAHLGGMAVGYFYFRFIHDAQRESRALRSNPGEPPARVAQAPTTPATVAFPTQIRSSHDEIRAEVDRILDKINSEGFAALTPAEKRILGEAKDAISRR